MFCFGFSTTILGSNLCVLFAFSHNVIIFRINVIDVKITFCILHNRILTSYILVYILGYHAPYIFMMLEYYYYYYYYYFTTLTY